MLYVYMYVFTSLLVCIIIISSGEKRKQIIMVQKIADRK